MIIGVAAVITIASLGQGARATIEEEIEDAGTNLVIVSGGNWTSGGARLGLGSSSTLTADAAAATRSIPGVADVSPSVRTRAQIIAGGQNWSASLEGVGADLPMIRAALPARLVLRPQRCRQRREGARDWKGCTPDGRESITPSIRLGRALPSSGAFGSRRFFRRLTGRCRR